MLKKIITAKIKKTGPIGLDKYMALCLSHPEHGYYMKQQPFGVKGDFTTAPEISQMFGELVGLWLVHQWQALGSPEPFALVELGPGRGTLMSDILRVARSQPAFLRAAKIYLLESSEKLRGIQRTAFSDYSPTFLDSIVDLPNIPLILVANEFFDALPVKQYIKNDFGWQECLVDEELKQCLSKTSENQALEARFKSIETGRVVEVSAQSKAISNVITKHISSNTGVALIIDYGAFDGVGDTLQAVKNHQKTNPFTEPGQADLTTHVRFSDIVQNGVKHAFTTQGEFLSRLGIDLRRQALEKASERSFADEQNRLVESDQMGQLFKVLALSSDSLENAAGFCE